MSGIAIFLLVELLALIGVHEIGCDVKFRNQDAVLEDFEITKSEVSSSFMKSENSTSLRQTIPNFSSIICFRRSA